ncbi:hypothetical protein [Mycolicibacterium vaccae]|uniref:hypothetical protein n=1 Tax=Mycolicibacterium vaccae TaxID=1810 RepID=UPI003D02D5A6
MAAHDPESLALGGTMTWPARTLLAVVVVGSTASVVVFGRVHQWQLGNVGEWLSAVFAAVAAGAALWIATRDRQEREQERRNASRAQAELVQVSIGYNPRPNFTVEVSNFSSRPILNVQFVSARYKLAPGVKAELVLHKGRGCPVLDTDRRPYAFEIAFLDEEGHSVLQGQWDDVYSEWDGEDSPDPDHVQALVSFQDADGTGWIKGTHSSPTVFLHRGDMWYRDD